MYGWLNWAYSQVRVARLGDPSVCVWTTVNVFERNTGLDHIDRINVTDANI